MSKIYIETSAQHGKGVFAAAEIAVGERIIEFGGPLLRREQIDAEDYHLQIGADLYLGPSGGADDYINHSCAPNAAFCDGLTLVALRTISTGEEITWDYSTAIDEADFAGFPCACRAPECRGTVHSFRHLESADQRRLAAHVLPYLRDAIYGAPE